MRSHAWMAELAQAGMPMAWRTLDWHMPFHPVVRSLCWRAIQWTACLVSRMEYDIGYASLVGCLVGELACFAAVPGGGRFDVEDFVDDGVTWLLLHSSW